MSEVVELPDGPADEAGLTARQRQILTMIRDSVDDRGYPPSVREIGEAVGLTSPSSVAYQLKSLEKLGYLEVDDWLRWRDLRNRLAHEYPDQSELRHAQLLAAVAGAAEMLLAYRAWAARLPANSA